MGLWIVLALMTAIAAALIAVPLMRRAGAEQARSDYDVAVYRDQLAEIERDTAQGMLSTEEAEGARAEIARRLLAATTGAPDARTAPPAVEAAASRSGRTGWAAAVLAVAVPVAALAVYLSHGAPDLPGQPAAKRLAGRAAPDQSGAAAGRSDEALVAELSRRMQERPDDPKGWALLGRSLLSLGRASEGADAYARAAAILPHDADLHARLGEARMQASDGRVTDAAREAFNAALAADPKEPRSRYYLGLAELQAGNERVALDHWIALEADSPPDAPWREQLGIRIATLAARLGVDADALRGGRGAPAPRGPSAADVAAAQQMAPDQRMAMIRSMVESLASRLETQPDDLDGWMRLGRSYGVLGEAEKSRDAYARAARLRPDDSAVQSAYAESLLRAAGDGPPSAELSGVVQRLLARDPDNREALWLAGLAASRLGDAAAARAHWGKLLAQLSPGSPEHAALKKRVESLASN